MQYTLFNPGSTAVFVEYDSGVYRVDPNSRIKLSSAGSHIQLKVYISDFSKLRPLLFIKSIITKYKLNLTALYNVKLTDDNASINLSTERAKGPNSDEYSFVKLSGVGFFVQSMRFSVFDAESIKSKMGKAHKNVTKAGLTYGIIEIGGEILGFALFLVVLYIIARLLGTAEIAAIITIIMAFVIILVSCISALIFGLIAKRVASTKSRKFSHLNYKNKYSLLEPEYIYNILKINFMH